MVPVCLGCLMPRLATWAARQDDLAAGASSFRLPLPGIDDDEGARVDPKIDEVTGGVVDAHVHLFPDRLFEAIWRWFDVHGWPIRYKLTTPRILDFLLAERGIDRIVALHYAHKPGLARAMNTYMAEIVRGSTRVTGLATVMPGEPDAEAILRDAFAAGLSGVKLHCHVQCLAADDPKLAPIYAACVAAGKPVVIHAGREPTSAGYACDPYALCHVDRVRVVLEAYPKLSLVVPHLGFDEVDGYRTLLERHDNLWLDTTMALSGLFGIDEAPAFDLVRARPERILYGTDFPNIPYAWDRELRRIASRGWDDATLAQIFARTARSLYRLPTVGRG